MDILTQCLMAVGDVLIGFTFFIIMLIIIYFVGYGLQSLIQFILGK